MTKAEKAIYDREYRKKNRAKILAAKKQWYLDNREEMLAGCRVRYTKKAKEISRKATAWNKANPDRKRAINRRYNNKRYATNSSARLMMNLRSRVRAAMKGVAKARATIELIGCSVEDLWIYLESKFEPGMTRENHGKVWHVDHIMPCAIFDLTRAEHQRRCFHFSNLQPLFVRENLRKSSKVTTNQFRLL